MKTLLAVLSTVLALVAYCDDEGEFRAGHSAHGEVFNEGPRQAAYLMDGMPDLNVAVTTSSTDAQKFFSQAIGQLHGFWYFGPGMRFFSFSCSGRHESSHASPKAAVAT